MKIRMLEACDESSKGSLGCKFVVRSAKQAGFDVTYIDDNSQDKGCYDVELISIHHCSDFPRLLRIKKKAKIRIIGGHPMQNNPRPVIKHADVICIGEAETWIKEALKRLSVGLDIEALKDLPGTIISSGWVDGSRIPTANIEKIIPNNSPVLSKASKGHAATWYIEIGRGCPFSCSYCELGHSVKARMRDLEDIKKAIDSCDKRITKKLTLFAPDEASHRGYSELLDYIHEKGFITQFGSMRLDQIMRNGKINFKMNMLIRVGLDGLSERIRFKVNKKLSDDLIVRYFHFMFEKGHVNFKVFQIFSYNFETLEDWNDWVRLYKKIGNYDFKKNVMLRIKFTPFIPQPITPLADEKPVYNIQIASKIKCWLLENKKPTLTRYGIHLTSDGMMGLRSHKAQCLITSGDENFNLEKYYF